MGKRTHGIKNVVLGCVAATLLTACSAQFRNHGYAPTDAELAEVIVGVDTRASVEDLIGAPTTGGVLTDSAYYYVESRWRHFAFLAPAEIDRQLVAISFDADGVVTNIERFTLADGRVVTLSRRVTDSTVRNTTFLRQLLGNLGNFDAGQIVGSDG